MKFAAEILVEFDHPGRPCSTCDNGLNPTVPKRQCPTCGGRGMVDIDWNEVADDFEDWTLDLPAHFDDIRYRRPFRIIGTSITETPVEVTHET